MQEIKFQLKTNICANFQENTEYQDSRGMLVFGGMSQFRLAKILKYFYITYIHFLLPGSLAVT
jgi:hypothetical protein